MAAGDVDGRTAGYWYGWHRCLKSGCAGKRSENPTDLIGRYRWKLRNLRRAPAQQLSCCYRKLAVRRTVSFLLSENGLLREPVFFCKFSGMTNPATHYRW